MDTPMSGLDFARLANNFYVSKGLESHVERIDLDAQLANYIISNQQLLKQKYKVAFCCICMNAQYWQYIIPMINGAKQMFLPGHQTDFFLWSDFPEQTDKKAFEKGEKQTLDMTLAVNDPSRHPALTEEIKDIFQKLQTLPIDATIFPVDPVPWPMPTLLRYHLMLQQEEKLKEYDYIFYVDIDMMFRTFVGDEILGERLTAVQQPMYAVRREWIPPYEPNSKSAGYIPRLGKIVDDVGRTGTGETHNKRFLPLYLAGGFQGGKSQPFIEAMKVMQKKIDHDMIKLNYTPIWNDETIWNSYLFENPSDQDIILTPSYTYPDNLIQEYFLPLWGVNYQPKIVTLTKKFSFQPGAGNHLQKMLNETQKLR